MEPLTTIIESHALVGCVGILERPLKVMKRLLYKKESLMRDGAAAARLSHKQKVGGSSPSPATSNIRSRIGLRCPRWSQY